MSFDFTPGQSLAIESRGSAVLVSAAAGSGKTRVLTERLLRRVDDADTPVDIDRFLVITYTRAAAAELRSRIMDALTALAARSPADLRLRRQQSLCCRAPIGTIHSFCTTVLREYSQLLGLSPAFSVLDEDRAAQMKASVVSRLLDEHYEHIEDDADFRLLSDTVGAGRDDRALAETLLKLYEKLRSHPYPEDWAEAQKAALRAEGVNDVLETLWGRELMDEARASAAYWCGALEQAVEEIEGADDGGKIAKAYGGQFADAAAQLRDLCRAMDEGWDRARAFSVIRFENLGRLVKYPDPELKDKMSAVWNGCKSACGKLSDLFSQSSDTLLRDLRRTAPAMSALMDLTLEFDRAYAAEKQRRSALDFSDLEHYAARLLVDKATGAPTWVAVELSHRYAEIMVDEYQDVNAVQEMIFRAVSRNGTNLFLVGDVKQSIYRFRLADPGLFLEKYRSFAPAEVAAPGEPRKILLQENFRSRRAILDAANCVMGSIMSETLGELNYDGDAALKFGAKGFGTTPDVPVELHIIDSKTSCDAEDEEPPEAAALEARFVANKILELVRSGAPVTEGDGTRPCNFGDFVLLMRSPGGKGKVFHRALAEAGIPVESRQGGGFFSSLEVTVTVDLLSVIDNPHTDVPLISVLRSPAFGFSADELSAIRTADRKSDFYSALCAAADGGNVRCAAFRERLNAWRSLAPEISLDELVWRLCSETGMFAICSAMGEGELRRQNLMHLFELARSFGESGYRGLYRFVQWLRRMAESGNEPELAPTGQAVRIMTIHKSKGLEFPFVFLCDLSHKFNKDDFKARVLLHTELGLGPRVVDAAGGQQYPTVAFRAIRQRQTRELLSEEMRVLYVAMTRAKERLYLSCAWGKAQEKLDKLTPRLQEPLPPELLKTASGFASWVAMAALLHPETIPIVLHGIDAADTNAPDAAPVCPPEREAVERELTELKARLEFMYPWAGAAELPSKLTATELKRPGTEPEDDAFSMEPEPELEFRLPEPGATSAPTKLSAASRGTATHTLLQYLDLGKTDSAETLRTEAERLVTAGLLRPEEADAIDYVAVGRFFASPVGQRLTAAQNVRREFRFLLLSDAAGYFPGAAPEDQVMVQGVVDCCFEEFGGITVLDYKTDRITPAEIPQRAERYRAQLSTYAAALERSFQKPVKHCILWFLHPGGEYEVAL